MLRDGASRRAPTFVDVIRARGGGCAFLGKRNRCAIRNDWSGYGASHVWPLGGGDIFANQGFSNTIFDMPGATPGARINSTHNGVLLTSSIQKLFDQYQIAVHPVSTMRPGKPHTSLTLCLQENYKLIVFKEDHWTSGDELSRHQRKKLAILECERRCGLGT